MWVQFATQCRGAWLRVYNQPEISSEVLHGLSHLIFSMALEVSFIFFLTLRMKKTKTEKSWQHYPMGRDPGFLTQKVFASSVFSYAH